MPTDDTKQPTTTSVPPIFVEPDALPPMPQVAPTPQIPPQDTGSSAPSDDIIMPAVITTTTPPKKRFAGGKIIATILGLFLLVGGTGAGIYLVQQNQNINEEARSRDDPSTKARNADGSLNKNRDTPANKAVAEQQAKAKFEETDVNNAAPPDKVTPLTVAQIIAMGGVATTSDYPTLTGDQTSDCSGGRCNVYDVVDGKKVNIGEFRVAGAGREADGDCVSTGYGACTVSCGGGTQTDNCGHNRICNPQACTEITASCQNIKAYSEAWVLLTTTQLSALETGDIVNFCATGVASSGLFDKAKFTINAVVQAETTLVRPSSTDFCQTYTIPTGTTTFNVTALIHHATLGWK